MFPSNNQQSTNQNQTPPQDENAATTQGGENVQMSVDQTQAQTPAPTSDIMTVDSTSAPAPAPVPFGTPSAPLAPAPVATVSESSPEVVAPALAKLPFTVYVKTLTGKTIACELGDILSDPEQLTVAHLKQMVSDKEGLNPEQQRIIYGGKQVEDSQFLKDCVKKGPNGEDEPIRHKSEVHLVVALRGGCL